MSKVKDILEGHLNELLGKGLSLANARLQICTECPIHMQSHIGVICNPNKWINEENEVRDHPQEGFVRGCGCRMSAKATLEHATCVIGKW